MKKKEMLKVWEFDKFMLRLGKDLEFNGDNHCSYSSFCSERYPCTTMRIN